MNPTTRRYNLCLALFFATFATQAGEPQHRDLPYIPNGHARNVLDLYLPAPGPTPPPLVVFIHGGAWLAGDKSRPPALALLQKGYAVASLNYRLSQHAIFPAQITDCKAAIRWLRANASKYGYNAERIGVWGPSAGGHLVALLGASNGVAEFDVGENLDASSRVQCVVDYYGPTDLLQMGKQSGPDSRISHDSPTSPESKLVGGAIQEKKELAAKANPITYLTAERIKEIPPFLIVHGDKDNVVPLGQSELLRDALAKLKIEHTLTVLPGAGHGGREFASDAVRDQVQAFFEKNLKSEK